MTTASTNPSVHTNGSHTKPTGGGVPRLSTQVSDATLIKWLRDMIAIREFENRCAQAYQQAKIGGFCHLYIGQEACAVGTVASLNPDDPIVTAYRDHGHALARGMSARACMAEMFGKASGCAKGKGGSMHMFDKPHWLFGGHGIVGAQTPLGTGLAFGARYEWEVMKTGKRKVALAFLGDGALNQGALHEAMNLAGLWDLPVIYVVENNRYSMGTHIERGTTMAINLLSQHLLNDRKCLTDEKLKEIVEACKAEAVDALEFAEREPAPDLSELYTDVYAQPQPGLSPMGEYTHGAKNPLL